LDLKQRKARLIELIARLRGGQDVAQRDLKNVLLDDEYRALQDAWMDQRQLRDYASDKPSAVIEYEARLKKALFEYSKAEALNPSSAELSKASYDGLKADQRAYRRAETLLERLIEYLEEQLAADPGLETWFDRPLVFGMEGDISPSPSTMPRVVTSRSVDRMGCGRLAGIRSKREIKLEVLEMALQAVEAREALEARVAAQIAEEEARELAARRAGLRLLRAR
jgi:hypothetical protein